MADQPVKIADLFTKISKLAAQEEKGMGRMVGTMLPVLAWLEEPVVLKPGSLGDAFRGYRSVTLEAGAKVVMTDLEGKVSTKELASFRTEECLAIIHESFPELQRLVAEKRRAGNVKPQLSLKIELGGPHFVVDRRSYRLKVSNTGGDCLGLRVAIRLAGLETKPHPRLCDVNRGEEAEVDLGVFKEVGTAPQLELRIDCKDMDGRKLSGDEWVSLDGASWQEATLRSKD
jgi:hypothetical protein